MKVLSVASEVYPLIKTGGLADVAGALPGALARQGVAVRTLLPGYPKVMAGLKAAKPVMKLPRLFGGDATLLAAQAAGLDLLVLDAPHLYDRAGGPYGDASGKDWPDNWQRFAALSRAGADIAAGRLPGWRPDAVHVHDWQAALALAYMRYDGIPVPGVITIHNIAFQGHFGASIFGGLGLPASAMGVDGVEYYGGVGYLKAGIQAAGAITTVSPTYAQEIRTAEFGMGLEGLVNARSGVLHGIVNGIDTDVWNPRTDANLASGFSSAELGARQVNLAALEKRFSLSPYGMLVTVISRLTWQKGMDVLAESFDALVARGIRFAILGSGDAALEAAFAAAAARHPGRIGYSSAYDEPLSHLLQGGADAILVPSRFEPCGLTQLYGLRYGCVPIVTRTGGLADTVIDANDAAIAAGVATGFQFSPLNTATLVHVVSRAQATFENTLAWQAIQKRGMAADVSWDRSAALYRSLYDNLLEPKS